MKIKNILPAAVVAAGALLYATPLYAHCDTMAGPVVTAARTAFAKDDITPVLKWVKSADEPEIKSAFAQASAVRRQSPEAAQLAETWFFETLVRVHRAGEGAPYTGLKSEAAIEPGIGAADAALESGSREELLNTTIVPLQAVMQKKYERTKALKAHADHSVAAGREYVAAYVDYVHFAERLASLAASPSSAQPEHAH